MHELILCLVALKIDGVSIGLGTFTIPVDVVADCLAGVLVALPGIGASLGLMLALVVGVVVDAG